MKRYELGTTTVIDDDDFRTDFYTVADAIANGDWDFVKKVADAGDKDAISAISAINDK